MPESTAALSCGFNPLVDYQGVSGGPHRSRLERISLLVTVASKHGKGTLRWRSQQIDWPDTFPSPDKRFPSPTPPETSDPMRLDRYIAQTTDLSRALVKVALRDKRVMVNGEPVRDASLDIKPTDSVVLDGDTLRPAGPRYFMLHKPAGYICATTDSHHPTVIDLLDMPNKQTLHIAGRLDIDTTGLVLITDDGQWNHRVTSPRRECQKTYCATLAADLVSEAEEKLQAGLQLNNEKNLTRPAVLERLSGNRVRLTISEGKYHQVKRMFAALDNRVTRLHRERIGAITLDESLQPGEYRALTDTEVNSIP